MTSKTHQVSESFSLGALLAVVGGFLDAYTYLLRGKVFANAQTGNIVLFGISLTERKFSQAFLYLLPILAFGGGVILSEIIRKIYYNHPRIHWRQVVILLEIIILFCVAFIPAGKFDSAANILISFICAMQVEGFRKVHGNPFATTMCTGNLRSAMEALYCYGSSREAKYGKRCMQYLGIILFFIIGAGLGTLSITFMGIHAVFLCCLLLALAFGAMFIENKKN